MINETNKSSFFNKKQYLGLLVWTLILLVIIIIASKYVVKIDFHNLARAFQLHAADQKRWLIAAFIFGISFFVFNIYSRQLIFWMQLKQIHLQVKWHQWLEFSLISLFIQVITPFSIGSEPYAIWWLKKHHVPLRKASIIIFINTIMWGMSQVLVTWPAFVIYTINHASLIKSGQISFVYYLVLLGLLVDIVVMIFVFAFSYSRHLHLMVSGIFNQVKKLLRLHYLTKAEIVTKYLTEAIFKNEFRAELCKKQTLLVIATYALVALGTYFCFLLFYIGFSPNYHPSGWWDVFNTINIATTANNFVPIPSTEGTLQFTIKTLLVSDPNILVNGESLANTLFIWRFFTNYLLFFMGLIIGGFYTLKVIGQKSPLIYQQLKQKWTRK